MADSFRTLIVTAATAPLARELAASFGSGGQGMWNTPLSADGIDPATHFISSGYIPAEFAYMVPYQEWEWRGAQMYQDVEGTIPVTGPDQPVGLVTTAGWVLVASEPGDPVAVYQAASAQGVTCTLADVEAIFADADVTAQAPFVAMGRLGLTIIQPPVDI